jgi:K+-transporting ATPase ATPase C chain
MRKELITATIAIVFFTLLLGVAYPLAITGVSQVLFPNKADGSRIEVNGRTVGSKLIGQSFQKAVLGKDGNPKTDADGNDITTPDRRYFQSRPSATGYSADVTFFNNLGPNNRDLASFFHDQLVSYLKTERPYDPGLRRDDVPVDAVTTSASGVDPHISQANAWIQAHRVAEVRGISLGRVNDLINRNTDGRGLGLFGEPGVNVLELNLALDKEAPVR